MHVDIRNFVLLPEPLYHHHHLLFTQAALNKAAAVLNLKRMFKLVGHENILLTDLLNNNEPLI